MGTAEPPAVGSLCKALGHPLSTTSELSGCPWGLRAFSITRPISLSLGLAFHLGRNESEVVPMNSVD